MENDIRVAIIVDPALPAGLLANTVGAISIGLGAKFPALAASRLTDRQGSTVDIMSSRPVPVLQAGSDAIRALMFKAMLQSEGKAVVPFPAFARSIHSYAEYERIFPDRDLAGEAIEGVGLAGPPKWIRSLTGAMKLLR